MFPPTILLLLLLSSFSSTACIFASPLSTVSISYSSKVPLVCALVNPSSTTGDNYNLTCTSLLPTLDQRIYTSGPIASSALAGANGFLCYLTFSANLSTMVWWYLDQESGYDWGIDYKRVYRGPPLAALSAGDSRVCAIHEGGRPTCWRWKQLVFPKGIRLVDIAVGGDFVCGLLHESMEIRCFGNDTSVVRHNMSGPYQMIAAGSRHACAVSTDGKMKCWGPGAPVGATAPGFKISSLALGADKTCALGSNGIVKCWGNYSKLPWGLATTEFMAIQAKGSVICGIIKENYSLACWGNEILFQHPIVYEQVLPGRCVPQSSCRCGPLEGSGLLCSSGDIICHPCENKRVVVIPPSASPPSSRPPPPPPPPPVEAPPSSHTRRTGIIVIGSVGLAIGLLASVCFCLFYFGRCNGRVHDWGTPSTRPRPSGGESSASLSERLFSSLLGRGRQTTMEFQLSSLLSVTGNFSESHKTGSGSFGSVYKATLEDGRVVAIKRAEASTSSTNTAAGADNKRCEKEWAFLSELALLSRVNHKNLVRLLGYCKQNSERVLVYEFMTNGTLHENLHGVPASAGLGTWRARLRVALDAARGLEYLHVYAVPPIIHRDIKSSNILLDDDWTAKVSDFGLSLMSPASEEERPDCPGPVRAAGTVGYMDPEYYRLQRLTAKSDVYSFGVVLLELLTGCKVISRYEGSGTPKNVVDFAVPHIADDDVHRVLDPKLPPPMPSEIEAVTYVGYLAIDCVSPEGRARPTMTEVVNGLERALAACGVPDAGISRSDTVRSV